MFSKSRFYSLVLGPMLAENVHHRTRRFRVNILPLCLFAMEFFLNLCFMIRAQKRCRGKRNTCLNTKMDFVARESQQLTFLTFSFAHSPKCVPLVVDFAELTSSRGLLLPWLRGLRFAWRVFSDRWGISGRWDWRGWGQGRLQLNSSQVSPRQYLEIRKIAQLKIQFEPWGFINVPRKSMASS